MVRNCRRLSGGARPSLCHPAPQLYSRMGSTCLCAAETILVRGLCELMTAGRGGHVKDVAHPKRHPGGLSTIAVPRLRGRGGAGLSRQGSSRQVQ